MQTLESTTTDCNHHDFFKFYFKENEHICKQDTGTAGVAVGLVKHLVNINIEKRRSNMALFISTFLIKESCSKKEEEDFLGRPSPFLREM